MSLLPVAYFFAELLVYMSTLILLHILIIHNVDSSSDFVIPDLKTIFLTRFVYPCTGYVKKCYILGYNSGRLNVMMRVFISSVTHYVNHMTK